MATKKTNTNTPKMETLVAKNLNVTDLPVMAILKEVTKRGFCAFDPQFEKGKKITGSGCNKVIGICKGASGKKDAQELLDVVYTLSGANATKAASNLLSIVKLMEEGVNPSQTITINNNEYVIDIEKRVAATIYGKVVADLNDLKDVKLTKDQIVKLLIDRLRLVPGNATQTVFVMSNCGRVEVSVDRAIKMIVESFF